MKGRLTFTCGLPRSGKSTYARIWMQERELGQPHRIIISGDAFRYAIHGHAYIKEAENVVFTAMDIAARALLHDGFDVIVDETSTSESTILRYLRIDIEATPIFIDTPMDVCIERAKATNRSYLIGPIQRMHEQLVQLKAEWPANFERLKSYLRSRQDNDVVAS